MSTHNICIRRKIRKILCGYPLLSVAMKIPSPPCPLSRFPSIYLSWDKDFTALDKKNVQMRYVLYIFLIS